MSAPADRAAYALMVLDLADVIEEFDDRLWVSISREDWETLYPPPGTPAAFSAQPESEP